MMTLTKIPPQDLDAEKQVLSTVFQDPQCFIEVSETLHPEDFYRSAHQEIFAAMCALGNNDKPIDLVTVTNLLKQKQKLEECGGPVYMAQLLDYPMSVKVSYPAGIVKEKSIKRSMIAKCVDGVKACYEDCECNISELVDKIQGSVFGVNEESSKRGSIKIADAVQSAIDLMQERQKNGTRITGVPTGFQALDFNTGGFQNGDFIILAARPSMGKTALAMNIAKNAAYKNGTPVAIFSLEMSTESLTQRLIASTAMVNSQAIRTGTLKDQDWKQIIQASEIISNLPIHIVDHTPLTQVSLRNELRRMKQKHGIGLAIIDYIQLMRGVQTNKKINNTNDEVSEISRSMKLIAGELKIPLVALSQLNRAVEDRTDKRPRLSDLRDSGSLEQDADIVMFIYRDEVYNKSENNPNRGLAELNIAKHRNGPIATVPLVWLDKYTKFENAVI